MTRNDLQKLVEAGVFASRLDAEDGGDMARLLAADLGPIVIAAQLARLQDAEACFNELARACAIAQAALTWAKVTQ